ncbi:YqaJ viral recombinase family protein [Stutzerimonas xanthomarina]|uniref:Phage-type endonuclease n=2 Tax=Stutzerimonas xanthomarina TaxID=271420 RepID=A0ABY0ZXR5_9GAMM|nr:putative phage-type endonuclease [Stutzerimonas xanthomarina]SHG79309.1 putative phage-type endonuclease [Stutzerimonas xanthomarina DSM 18231]
MSMIIHDVQQGSTEWHALRLEHFTASEAPAMLGVSKYQTRSDLLQQKKTGLAPEVDAATQRLFDNGHATEAMARPIVERMIGEDLYPVVGTLGNLLASMDGMTMLGDTLFEHKALNQSLIQQIAAGELEAHYWVQLEQQLYVSGAQRVIFVCSDGTEENFHHLEYRPVPGRIEQILAGWKQFEEDLAAFVPEAPAVPKAVGRTPETLPALRIEVTGMVTNSNLDAFKAHALDVIGAINRDLVTDQDFADAEQAVKWCGEVEDKLKAAKQHALSQTESIDRLFSTLDDITAEARRTRLELDKLVKAMKETRRQEIKISAETAFAAHIAAINKRLGKVQLPQIRADFAGVMKGKRTISTLQDATDTELARVKIEANAIAEGIETNLVSLRELAKDHAFLFTDAQQLVLKDNEALTAIVKGRIAEHEAAEQTKAEARAEAERERIREEERQRLEQEQKEQADRAAAEQAAKIVEPPQAQPAAAEPISDVASVAPVSEAISLRPTASAAPAQLADDGQRIKLGDINARLGFSLTADFLRSIGIESVGRDRAAVLYRASDFARICTTLIAHIGSLEQRIAA